MTEEIEQATIKLLDSMRIDHLQTTGASPLKQYDRLQTRALAAAGRSETVRQWVTDMMRGLGITSPSRWLSTRIAALVGMIEDSGEFLDWLRDEIGFLIAMVQVEIDERKAAKKEVF